ncbi:hypothetical protein QYF50_06345 [Paenibacillus vini]|uniref:hypothetical protein n=1 Tax=Paenibacillus vini TaxID=1476024 RepID=UPI0025B6E8D6|nr:hypothetical protein [Paenibacillus vini]MDN4067510.1 hypothetical protein [Paenibacillus vini]
MEKITQFIFTEVEAIKEYSLNGVYSKEFALGHLSGLNNLANLFKLKEAQFIIRHTVNELGSAADDDGERRQTPLEEKRTKGIIKMH